MLAEIRNARQIAGEDFRRWFTDEEFDLIVWYGDDRSLVGFQLCYDKQDRERALTWTSTTASSTTGSTPAKSPGTRR